MEAPIKTISNIPDKDLEKACAELESMGYMVIQRSRTGDEVNGSWRLKAKLKDPPARRNRELV